MMNKPGSALVYVLVFTSILLICCSGLWRATMFGFSIVHKRQRYDQYVKATEGVFNYGVAWFKVQGKKVMSEKNIACVDLTFDSWPSSGQELFRTLLHFEKKEKGMLLRAVLIHDGSERCALSALLSPSDDFKSVTISEWNIESV